MQLLMVILDIEQEETGAEDVAIATSKCIPSGRLYKAQHPCRGFNSNASLLAEIFLILCLASALAQPVKSSVTKFA